MKKLLFVSLFNVLSILPAQAETKIAVMPFEVLSKDPNVQQFGLGTTDTLTNALSSVPDFIMVDRGQMNMIMKEQALQNSGFTDASGAAKIGKILNVDLLILGSIQSEDKSYRITAKFTNVETGKILKSVQVTGNSIFSLQDQLASEIITSQKVNITPAQKERIDNITNATNNLTAYDYFIKGRTSYLKFTEDGFKEAINYFDKALEVDKNYTLALATKSEAEALLSYELKKNGLEFETLLKEAETNALSAINKENNLAESHRALSLIYNLQRKRKAGQEEAQKAIMLNPSDAEAYVSLWINTRYEPDAPEIQKAITLNPYLVPAYNQLGLAYNMKRKYSEAIENFQKAIKINPEYTPAYLNLGLAYQEQKETDKAIKAFENGITSNPKYSFAYYHLGSLYSQNNNFALAESNFKQAISINPKFNNAFLELGKVYNKQKKYQDAVNVLKKALEINPKYKYTVQEITSTYQNLANELFGQKNYKDAIISYRALTELNPNDVFNLVNLGISHYLLGEYSNAIEVYNKALTINPNNPDAHDNLGMAYQATGKNDLAVTEYKKACELGKTVTCDWLKENKL